MPLKEERESRSYGHYKLDMSKAYERVEWGFLQGMMVKMGFNQKWVDLIMECISSVSYYYEW